MARMALMARLWPGVHLQCHQDLNPVLPPRGEGELRENSGENSGEQGPLNILKVKSFREKGRKGQGKEAQR